MRFHESSSIVFLCLSASKRRWWQLHATVYNYSTHIGVIKGVPFDTAQKISAVIHSPKIQKLFHSEMWFCL